MATPLKYWRKQAKLRWLLLAICLALPCASSVQGQAVTRAVSRPQRDTVVVSRRDTVVVVERIVGFYSEGGTIKVDETDTLVVEMVLQDSMRTSTPFVVVIREKPPPPISWPWWIVALLALLLMMETYMLWRIWHYIPLLLKYRDQKAWSKIYRLVKKMPASLAKLPLLRQQHAFALNRDDRSEEAERVLRGLLEERGPSTKTNGILGRVYKDRWEAARKAGQTERAAELLDQAVETYLAGHEAHPKHP